MDVTAALKRAIETGEVLLVKYHGGSKPGESRLLSPMAFVGDDKFRAHCHASGRNKVFVIDKIEILDDTDHATATYESAPVAAELQSLVEALAGKIDSLRNAGWHVEQGPEFCSLHRYFKNGKPRKSSAVVIQFNEFVPDTSDDSCFSIEITAEGVKTEFHGEPLQDPEDFEWGENQKLRKSTRPWSVGSSEAGKSATFKSLGKAVNRFMELAAELDPAAR